MLLRALELVARRRRSGGHPAWAAVTFATFLLRQYKKRAHRQQSVIREELQPGESLLITHHDRPRG